MERLIERQGLPGGRMMRKVWSFSPGMIRMLASKSLEACEALDALLLAARNA